MTTKYIIEGNISFYDELYKSLDDSDDEKDDVCQITGEPLTNTSVTMECGHKFNYLPLYKEIYNQKYIFNTYTIESLNNKNKIKFQNECKPYYIKCPYCRDIQFTILPYYQELCLNKVYGINSLDFSLPDKKLIHTSYGFNHCGKLFMNVGKPCSHNNCSSLNVACIIGTELNYCIIHWREGNKQYKQQQKEKKILEKKKIIEEKKQQKLKIAEEKKEQNIKEKVKAFELKNAERIAKGLKPLAPRKKCINKNIVDSKSLENTVIGQVNIDTYVPEQEPQEQISKINKNIPEELLCKGIISYGQNKGKQCRLKHLENQLYCFRHVPKECKYNNDK